MTMRHTLALLSVLALAGCSSSHGGDTEPDGSVPEVDGGGVCCPIADFAGCSPGDPPLPAGGWAASADACSATIAGFDGWPFIRSTDAQGCPVLIEDRTAPACGTIPDPCEGLGAVACFANTDCAPVWDDSCCPSCTDGPCADCTNPDYQGCVPFVTCRSPSCGQVPAWGCFPSAPTCADAVVIDDDSCSVAGCVPAVPAIDDTDPVTPPVCVPLTGDSCTTACRRVAPNCPEGTVPEGDGLCYTDRCIPAFACE